jgi:hypothetical protein
VNWRRVRRNELETLRSILDTPKEIAAALWEAWGPWSLIALPVGLVVGLAVLTVVAAIVGFLAAAVLDWLNVVDWVQYDSVNSNASAHTGDWVRWAAIGWGGFITLWLAVAFGGPVVEEFGEWNRAKERLRRERLEEDEE